MTAASRAAQERAEEIYGDQEHSDGREVNIAGITALLGVLASVWLLGATMRLSVAVLVSRARKVAATAGLRPATIAPVPPVGMPVHVVTGVAIAGVAVPAAAASAAASAAAPSAVEARPPDASATPVLPVAAAPQAPVQGLRVGTGP